LRRLLLIDHTLKLLRFRVFFFPLDSWMSFFRSFFFFRQRIIFLG